MHRFDADMDFEERTAKYDKLWDEALDRIAKSPNEYKVYETIWNTFNPESEARGEKVDYPEDFFEQSLDALNKHFGGSGDMVITENVRKALDAAHKWDMADDDEWDDMIGEEEEE